MNRFLILLTSAAVAFALTGCKDDTTPARTAAFYLEHSAERHEDLARCQNEAQLAMTPNCMNAKNADAEAGLKKRADFGSMKGVGTTTKQP